MIKRFICLLGAILGGVTLSQAPEYTQQYSQRLAGAVHELAVIIDQFDEDASRFGLTREEGLARYQTSSDQFLVDRGMSMQAVFARYEQLSTQLDALRTASPATRLVSLAQYFDTDVGAAALDDYKPAIPVTIEGFAFALIGLVLGYGLFWIGAMVAAAPFRRRRSRIKISRTEPRL